MKNIFKITPPFKRFGVVLVLVVVCSIFLTTVSFKSNISQGNGLPIIPVGSLDTYGLPDASSVFVGGAYAYVGTSNNAGATPEFYIVDISNPQTPSIVGSFNANSSINKIYASGDYAYLVTKEDTEDLVVLNISNKAQPVKVTSINIPNNSEALTINGSGATIYVGFANSASFREFYVFNISNPTSPQLEATYEVGGAVNSIALSQGDAYLATGNSAKELTVLNVSAPSNPFLVNSYDLNVWGGANGIAVNNDRIYLVTNNNASKPDLFVFQVDSSSAPILLASFDLNTSNTGVVAMGQVIFVTTQAVVKGVIKIDATDPSVLYQVSSYDGGAKINDAASDGRYIYLASDNNKKELQIIDSREGPHSKPNIVLILTDDQQWESIQYMPIVQRELVNKGVKFNNAFVTTGLCCPGRASILTGEYAHNHGIRGNGYPYGGATVFTASSTIATWLRDAGYTTGYFGKYLNQYHLVSPAIPPGWDRWNAFKGDEATGEDNYYNYTLNEDGVERTYHADTYEDDGLYGTDLLATRVSNFIQAQPTNKPFFAVYAPYAPHAPSLPAIRHRDMFKNIAPYRPASWMESDMSDKSPWWRTLPDRINQVYNHSDPDGYIKSTDGLRRAQIETLQAVDDGVGTILNTLEQKGISDDTMVVFISDNGYAWGEHWWNQKLCQYDECNRTPLITRYPLLANTPREENRYVLNIDLAPTFADFANIATPVGVNGKSLKKVLSNTENAWRSDFLLEGWKLRNNVNLTPTYASVHNSQWKYVNVIDDGVPFEELYNLILDPYEMTNVVSNPNNAAVLSQLRTRLLQLQAE